MEVTKPGARIWVPEGGGERWENLIYLLFGGAGLTLEKELIAPRNLRINYPSDYEHAAEFWI